MNDAEVRVALARLDERQKAADDRATRTEAASERALQLAVSQVDERRKDDWKETQRRLTELNGEAGRLKDMHAVTVSRELFDTRTEALAQRMEKLERMWLPVVASATLAGAVAGLLMRLLLH